MRNERIFEPAANADSDNARARYYELFNSSPVACVTVDREGNIQETNLIASSLFGLPHEKLSTKMISNFIIGEDLEIYFQHINWLFETTISQVFELRMIKENGTQFWARMEATAPLLPAKASYCNIIVNDITQYKRKTNISVPAKTPSPLEGFGGGTTLVIEDDEPVRKMSACMLEDLGFNVLQAGDGVEGLEEFQKHPGAIRFVLCDLVMPRMDGWKTMEALRKIDSNTRIIIVSGYDFSIAMEGNHVELPDAFLSKPYTLRQLCDTIQKVLALSDKATNS